MTSRCWKQGLKKAEKLEAWVWCRSTCTSLINKFKPYGRGRGGSCTGPMLGGEMPDDLSRASTCWLVIGRPCHRHRLGLGVAQRRASIDRLLEDMPTNCLPSMRSSLHLHCLSPQAAAGPSPIGCMFCGVLQRSQRSTAPPRPNRGPRLSLCINGILLIVVHGKVDDISPCKHAAHSNKCKRPVLAQKSFDCIHVWL
jgi:hypothetical protein